MPSFARWLRSLLGSRKPFRGQGRARRHARHRPTIELLEARALLDGNSPPVLRPIADCVLPHSAGAIPIEIVAYDPDGDPLTYSAQLVGPSAPAVDYQLDQRLGLTSTGNYSTNFLGYQEKWLQGNDAQYFILSDGQFRRWSSLTTSLSPAGLVANLDPR